MNLKLPDPYLLSLDLTPNSWESNDMLFNSTGVSPCGDRTYIFTIQGLAQFFEIGKQSSLSSHPNMGVKACFSTLRDVIWGKPAPTKEERWLVFKIDVFIMTFVCLTYWVN